MPIELIAAVNLATTSQGPQDIDPERAEACYLTYQTAEDLQVELDLSGDNSQNFTLRFYRSGARLSPAERARRSGALAFTSPARSAISQYVNGGRTGADPRPAFLDAVYNCDRDLGIPATAIEADGVEHEDCAVRYASLGYSTAAPQQRAHFADRVRFALTLEHFFEGFADVQGADTAGRESAQSYFPDGQMDASLLAAAFEGVRACDLQYGLAQTAIPDALHSAASGRP